MARYTNSGDVVNYNRLTSAQEDYCLKLFKEGYGNTDVIRQFKLKYCRDLAGSTCANLKARLIRDKRFVPGQVPKCKPKFVEDASVVSSESCCSSWSTYIQNSPEYKEFRSKASSSKYMPIPGAFRSFLMSGEIDFDRYKSLYDEAIKRNISFLQIVDEYKKYCGEFNILVDSVVNNSAEESSSSEDSGDVDTVIDIISESSTEESILDSSSVDAESSLPFVCMDYDETVELSPIDTVSTVIWEQISRAASLRDLDAVLLLSRLLAQITSESVK